MKTSPPAFALSLTLFLGPALTHAKAPSHIGQAHLPARLLTLLPEHSAYLAFQSEDQKPKPGDLPDGKGKDVTKRVCSGCHSVAVFAQQRQSQEKWASVLDQMIAKGLDASDDDLTTILNYLSTNLGDSKQNAPAGDAPAAPPSR